MPCGTAAGALCIAVAALRIAEGDHVLCLLACLHRLALQLPDDLFWAAGELYECLYDFVVGICHHSMEMCLANEGLCRAGIGRRLYRWQPLSGCLCPCNRRRGWW